MHNFFKNLSFLFLLALFIPACTVETIDDDDDSSSEISNQVAQGFTDADVPFLTESALVENTNTFGNDGYYFSLYSDVQDCSGNANGEVRFFVASDVPLTEGSYDGSGPFFGSTSFFGAQVEITSVNETTIEGKVKGGNFEGDKNIEGAFSATLCD